MNRTLRIPVKYIVFALLVLIAGGLAVAGYYAPAIALVLTVMILAWLWRRPGVGVV